MPGTLPGFLRCGKNINGAIEGDRYVVTWGLGHLVTLADPEDYDKKYKEWKMEDLPMMPEVFKLEVIKQTSKQYQAVKTQIYRGMWGHYHCHGCRKGRRAGGPADSEKDRVQ